MCYWALEGERGGAYASRVFGTHAGGTRGIASGARGTHFVILTSSPSRTYMSHCVVASIRYAEEQAFPIEGRVVRPHSTFPSPTCTLNHRAREREEFKRLFIIHSVSSVETRSAPGRSTWSIALWRRLYLNDKIKVRIGTQDRPCLI